MFDPIFPVGGEGRVFLKVYGLLKSPALKSHIAIEFVKTLPGEQLVPDTFLMRSGYFPDPLKSAVIFFHSLRACRLGKQEWTLLLRPIKNDSKHLKNFV